MVDNKQVCQSAIRSQTEHGKTLRQAPLHGVRLSVGPEPFGGIWLERHGRRPARGLPSTGEAVVGTTSSAAGRTAEDGKLDANSPRDGRFRRYTRRRGWQVVGWIK